MNASTKQVLSTLFIVGATSIAAFANGCSTRNTDTEGSPSLDHSHPLISPASASASGSTYCAAGLTYCSGACYDLRTSSAHCGTCTTACTGGNTCQAGVCACPVGSLNCFGTCIDVQFDANNCGACGHVCQPLEFCSNGSCYGTQ